MSTPTINPKDFAWLWQGIVKKPFSPQEIHHLKSITRYRNPQGHALLLLHGFSSTPAVFRLMLDSLSGYDAIVAPILPGHGTNLSDFANVSAQDWVTHVEAECEKLLKQYKKVDVLGLSLGGVLACHLSYRFTLHHLFLLSPAVTLHFPLNLGAFLPHLIQKLGIKTVRSRGGNIHYPHHTELTYRKFPLQVNATLLDFVHHFVLKPPPCKTDVFLGKYDAIIHIDKIARYFKDIPQATVHWLNDSAHILPLDKERMKIIQVIQSHLTS